MDKDKLDLILNTVEKPIRYAGGELNSIFKNPLEYKVHYAFCFPDIYEVGMSHLGTRIMYDVLNKRDDTFCERCFALWPDMEQAMEEHGEKLFSLESKTPLDEFDIVGFTLQHEMSYTNVLNMLKQSGIPLYSSQRREEHPIIMAGGPCAFNAEPMADFFDIVVIGEGEDVIGSIIEEYLYHKSSNTSRLSFFKNLSKHQGIYIPQLYDVEYKEGKFDKIIPSSGILKSSKH